MTSKSLFFNEMKENTKRRLWTVALISLIFFFAFPVYSALMISDYMNPNMISSGSLGGISEAEMKRQLLNQFMDWVSPNNGRIVLLMVMFAVVCGTSGFAYLHSKKKTDFFHSIPIRRETMFSVIYINGILYTAVPYLINIILSGILMWVKTDGGFSWNIVFSGFLIHMAFYILIYSTVITAVILTGNTIVSLLGTSVFFLWGPGVILLYYAYCSAYFKTFYNNQAFSDKLLSWSSPIAWYINMTDDNVGIGGKALWALAVAGVITAFAVFLYKKRPSEAAGRAMAFRRSQAVIKFLIVVPMALWGSLFFYSIKESDGWNLFGLLCGLAITYCIIEIIYNFDFRRLFAHKKQLAVCTIISAAILAFFRFDLSGYDSYLPSAEKVASSGISSYYLDSAAVNNYRIKPKLYQRSANSNHEINWDYGNEEELIHDMKLLNTEDVLSIAKQGIQDIKTFNDAEDAFILNNDYEELRDTVVISYHMKNGKHVFRRYGMNPTLVQKNLDAIYQQKEYKQAIYPILGFKAVDIAGINYEEYGDYRHVKLPDPAMLDEILTAYQEELSLLTTEQRRRESPIASLQFKTNEEQDMINIIRKEDGDFTVFNHFNYYPIYPSFTNTIALLKKCHINPGTFLDENHVEKIELLDYRVKDGNQNKLVVKDKQEIKELLEASVSEQGYALNRLNPLYERVEVTAFVPIDLLEESSETENRSSENYDDKAYPETTSDSGVEYTTYRLYLEKNKLPEFIRNRMPGSFD
ncbi:MAG: DUF6449 domain-containing protein [Clostridium sp.]